MPLYTKIPSYLFRKKGSGIYSAGVSGTGAAVSSGFSSSKFKVSKPPSSLILYSFAFVKFASRKAGEKAIKELDGAEIHGRKISVQESNDGGDRRRGKGNRNRNRR